MKIFKLLISAVSIMIISIMFIGCGHVIEEKMYKNKGKEIAQNYIKDKYGFEGNIIDVAVLRKNGSILDNSPPPTGKVLVKMEYDDVRFNVYADAKDDDGKCCDNYQMPEIEKAVISKVSEYVGNEPIGCNFYYGALIGADADTNGLIEEYFDGSNLDNILNNDKVQIMGSFEFVGIEDFYNLNNFRFSDKSSERLLFVNYRNAESIKKATIHNNHSILGNSQDKDIYENAVYIKNAKLIKDNSSKDFFIDVKESSGIYYFNPENNDDMYISTKEADDVSNWNMRGIAAGTGKIITPAYCVQKQKKNLMDDYNFKNEKNLHIFYPAEKLDKDKDYHVGIKYNNGEKTVFTTELGEFIGDYYHFTIAEDNIDQSFTIIEVDD